MKAPRFFGRGLVGSALACACLAASPPLHAIEVLFVGGQPDAAQGADPAIFDFLKEKYGENNVSYIVSGDSTTEDADGKDLVVLSSTPGSGSFRGKFRDVEAGVLNWEEALADAPRDGNFPFTDGGRPKSQQMDWIISDVAHPITENYGPGDTVTVFDPAGETWSHAPNLAEDAVVLATDPEEVGGSIVIVEKGGQLLNDVVSAGRRVMWGMTDSTANGFTDEGWELFGRALDWAANNLTDGSEPGASGARSASAGELNVDLTGEVEFPFEFNVRNTGEVETLQLSDFVLGGADADHFTIVETPATVAPKGEEFVKMSFKQKLEIGEFSATLTYTTNDPDEDDKEVVVELRAVVPNTIGPIAHFRLDEPAGSADALDSSGQGNDAEYDSNDGTLTLGGSGLKEGTGTSMAVSGGGLIERFNGFSLSEFSISLWFQTNSLGDLANNELLTLVGQGEGTPDVALLLASGELHWFGGEGTILFSSEGSGIEVGTVYHVTMIFKDGTGTIFLDGVEVATGDVDEPSSGGIFYAGAFGPGSLGLDGVLDDIQFYDQDIRDVDQAVDEIAFLLENPGKVLNIIDLGGDPDADEDGLADAVDACPNDPDCDGDGLGDGDEVNEHLTDPLVADTDGDGFEDGFEVANGHPPLDPSAPVAEDFLVVHYDFNEGSGTAIGNQAGDPGELVNAHAGAWVADGSPFDGSGYLNFPAGAEFGADSQHVLTGLDASEIPVSGDVDYTMMAWTRFENTDGDNMVFGQSEGNVLHNGSRGGQYYMGHWGNDIGGGTVEIGVWHHVAWRYAAGVQSIIVDGVQVGENARGALAVESEILIGTTRFDQDRSYTGDLDEVRIYSAALSDSFIESVAGLGQPAEGSFDDSIVALWPLDEADGAVAADAVGSHDGAVMGTAEWRPGEGRVGGAIFFDGSDGFIEVPDAPDFRFAEGESWTASLWYKTDAVENDQGLITKGYHDDSRAVTGYWMLQTRADTFTLDSRCCDGGNPRARIDSDSGISHGDGNWHHFVVARDGAAQEIRLYVDGQVTTTDISGEDQGLWAMGENEDPLVIANHFNRFTAGWFDDIAVWKGYALTDADVAAIAANGVAAALEGGGTPPGDRPGTLTEVMKADGGPFSFTISEGTFDVEYSTDLETWTVIASDVSGTYEDTDAGRNAEPAGYYRALAK